MNSIWKETSKFKNFPSLKGDIETDVLIVGGGISGLLCAFELKNRGLNYVLIEADRICNGVTQNTTAKVTMQHGLIYNKIVKKYGTEKAKMYLDANCKALEKYKTLSKKHNCDFEIKDSYVYSLTYRKILEDEISALAKIGYKAELCTDLALPFKTEGAVKFKNQGQFNPLKFLGQISEDMNIYENTKAVEFKNHCVITNQGKIKSKVTIIATHFPIINKHGFYFMKMYQHRSYVLAVKDSENINGMYVDEAEKGMSFRNYGDYLLIGGGDHRTGKKGGNYDELYRFAEKYYPDKEKYLKWATQDCITLDGIPYIGSYSEKTSDLYVITGFNKWGMTSAMAGAEIICDMILDKDNPYKDVFSPSRSIFQPKLFVNAAETAINLMTPTTPRCPHLGCALKYNKAEHSWDCPCHGSRFEENGKLIENPATDDLKKIKNK